jgi:hypothetical protein
LVVTAEVEPDQDKRNAYIDNYCHSYCDAWQICKRYITKNALQNCPDFVLPDTEMTVDEILEKWDADIQNS